MATKSDASRVRMRQSDAFSWYMERDALLRSTVVAVAVLDQPPDWERLLDRADRASRVAPMFRHRVVVPPLRLGPPRWVAVDDFDLAWHMRRVRAPEPGDLDAVLGLARNAAMTAFDISKPLWEFTLVEGLEGDEAAVIMKFHHALTDGIGGMQLALALFDLDRAGADLGPMPKTQPVRHPGPLALVTGAVVRDAHRVVDLTRRTPAVVVRTSARAVRHPLTSVREVVRNAESVAKTVAPVSTTLSPVMTGRELSRHLDVLEVSTDWLHRAALAGGGHLNDAFLAGITGGLRIYHEQHAAPVDQLRVTHPISIRKPSDAPGGNLITLLRFTLPTGIADPAERIDRITKILEKWRAEPSLDHTQAIAGGLNLLPSSFVGGMLKHVDFLASNVPGLPVPIFLAGARVTHYYPFGPTIGAAVNFTLMSYAGTCCIGVNMDSAAIPDPEFFMQCVRTGFDEVLALATAGTSTPTT